MLPLGVQYVPALNILSPVKRRNAQVAVELILTAKLVVLLVNVSVLNTQSHVPWTVLCDMLWMKQQGVRCVNVIPITLGILLFLLVAPIVPPILLDVSHALRIVQSEQL